MSTDSHSSSAGGGRHRVEGPKNHFITYLVSILLTMLAFAAVIYGGLDRSFLYAFLIGMAFVQVLFQMAIWMHMKEREHLYPIIGIVFGLFVALGGVLAAVYWTWW